MSFMNFVKMLDEEAGLEGDLMSAVIETLLAEIEDSGPFNGHSLEFVEHALEELDRGVEMCPNCNEEDCPVTQYLAWLKTERESMQFQWRLTSERQKREALREEKRRNEGIAEAVAEAMEVQIKAMTVVLGTELKELNTINKQILDELRRMRFELDPYDDKDAAE